MIRRPPRSTRTDTLFPYTTLFRSSSVVLGTAKVVDILEVDPIRLPDVGVDADTVVAGRLIAAKQDRRVAIQATRDRNRQEQIDGRQHLIPGGCEVETGSNRLFGGTAVPFILPRARCLTLCVEQRLTPAPIGRA